VALPASTSKTRWTSLAAQLALAGGRLVGALDQLDQQPVAGAAHGCVDAALERRHQGSVPDPEAGLEHLGRARHELLEGLLRPADEARRRLLLDRLPAAHRLGRDPLVLDHVLGRLAHHPAALVEALAPGPPGDLPEVAHREQPRLLAVELDEAGEQHGADRHVDADAERVGAAHHPQQAALGELLHQQPVAGQQPRVVQADPLLHDPLHVLAVRRVEADAGQRFGDRLALLAGGDLRAGQRLGLLGRLALGEEDHVDGRAPAGQQLLHRLVQRRLAPLEIERHRALVAVHVGHRPPALARELLLDRRRVAERGRHQQELRALEQQQRHLPGHAARGVGVEVELVHHHAGRVGGLALAERHVRQHLGGAADHGRRPVDAGVAGEHAHLLGPELLAEREELLADQRLHRRRVERAAPLAERLPVQRQRHQRLARAGRRGEHHVLARPQLEQRLLLRRVEREARVADPGDEAVERLLGRQRPGVRQPRAEAGARRRGGVGGFGAHDARG
jgi:hypothetical protein